MLLACPESTKDGLSNLRGVLAALLGRGLSPSDVDVPQNAPWTAATESSGDDEAVATALSQAADLLAETSRRGRGGGGDASMPSAGASSGLERMVLDIRVCSLGRFSMHEQVQLGKAADVYYSVHGNEMSNVLWMRGAGSASIEMQGVGPRLPTVFSEGVMQMVGVAGQVLGISPGKESRLRSVKNGISRTTPRGEDALTNGPVHMPPSHVVALIGEAVARVAEASVEEQLAEEREVHRMAARAIAGEYCSDHKGALHDSAAKDRPAPASADGGEGGTDGEAKSDFDSDSGCGPMLQAGGGIARANAHSTSAGTGD